jgi:predicted PurR-regulated permease PerM
MLSGKNADAATGYECLLRPPFYVLVFLAAYGTYLVLGPFLVPLVWAVVFAVVFHQPQVVLSRKIGSGRAALVMTLLVAVLIVAPGVILVSVLAQEAPRVTDYVQQASLSAPDTIERRGKGVRARIPLGLPEDPTQLVREAVQRILAFLAPRAGAVVADFVATIGSLVAMLFALYFMLRDGDIMGRQLRDLMPLPRAECERLLRDTRDLVIASVGAGMAVAGAQGTIGGVAFWLLGIGAPVFWGVVIALCSVVPVVGAVLVWAPAALWLMMSGEIWRGVLMALVGTFGISMVDNILRPWLLAGRTSVSGLVIFFGLLGGVAAFGFVGLVLGPIILVVTGRLLKLFTWPEIAAISAPDVVETQPRP